MLYFARVMKWKQCSIGFGQKAQCPISLFVLMRIKMLKAESRRAIKFLRSAALILSGRHGSFAFFWRLSLRAFAFSFLAKNSVNDLKITPIVIRHPRACSPSNRPAESAVRSTAWPRYTEK